PEAGVVVQHVQPAELLDRGGDGRLHLLRAGDVAGHCGGSAASLGDLAGGRLPGLAVDLGDHDGRPSLREQAGRRPTLPAARAGHDGDPAVQPQRTTSVTDRYLMTRSSTTGKPTPGSPGTSTVPSPRMSQVGSTRSSA